MLTSHVIYCRLSHGYLPLVNKVVGRYCFYTWITPGQRPPLDRDPLWTEPSG